MGSLSVLAPSRFPCAGGMTVRGFIGGDLGATRCRIPTDEPGSNPGRRYWIDGCNLQPARASKRRDTTGWTDPHPTEERKMRLTRTLAGTVTAIIVATGVSPFASSAPPAATSAALGSDVKPRREAFLTWNPESRSRASRCSPVRGERGGLRDGDPDAGSPEAERDAPRFLQRAGRLHDPEADAARQVQADVPDDEDGGSSAAGAMAKDRRSTCGFWRRVYRLTGLQIITAERAMICTTG